MTRPTAPPGPSNERDEVKRLVRLAFWIRAGLAVAFHWLTPEYLFAPDQQGYHSGATILAQWWSGDSAVYPARLLESNAPVAYYYIVASIYYLLGPWRLLPKLLNAAIGAITVLLTYRLSYAVLADHRAAMRAARLTAFLPSMVLWSVLNIRDVWVILVILSACLLTSHLQEGVSLRGLVGLMATLAALAQFRAYLLLPVSASLFAAFVAYRRTNLVRNAVLCLLVALALTFVGLPSDSRVMRSADLEILQEIRTSTSIGGTSNFEPEADISTPESALAFLPRGIAFFLFAPFPWSITGFRQVITLPEMLFLYSLVPAMLRGILCLLRRFLARALAVLLVSVTLILGYALGQSNAGTAYRHRAQVLPFLMLFAAAGMAGAGPLRLRPDVD